MRQIVLDTETTGLEPAEGHRIVEIGCVELINRRTTEHEFHRYLDPERAIDAGAAQVHGISEADLREQPRFADIAPAFLDYVRGAELIIHNAPFDVGFLDHELARGGHDPLACVCTVLDTLVLARRLHPGQRNSLDALCRRYGIDASHRQLHGALLDARILADVYLAMTGGQASLALEAAPPVRAGSTAHGLQTPANARRRLRVVPAAGEELERHHRYLEALEAASDGGCVWRRRES